MNVYFIVYSVFQLLGLGIHLARHGETRIDKYNFWTGLISSILSFYLVVNAILVGF